ncbi:MAG TPA: DUF4177 domain-containing protein [Micavibrio sp.]
MARKFEYKVAIYREPLLGSIFLGGSRVDPERYSEFLNRNAREGWKVITMERELRRELIFFKREAFLTVMEREAQDAS